MERPGPEKRFCSFLSTPEGGKRLTRGSLLRFFKPLCNMTNSARRTYDLQSWPIPARRIKGNDNTVDGWHPLKPVLMFHGYDSKINSSSLKNSETSEVKLQPPTTKLASNQTRPLEPLAPLPRTWISPGGVPAFCLSLIRDLKRLMGAPRKSSKL